VARGDVAAEPYIRTPDQRLRVFISSTLAELAPERAAVRAAIEQLHLTPVMFELGARPHPPRDLYRAYLAQSQVFLGIYGERYGWVAPGEQVSGLEDEFRLASNHPQLLYVREPAPHREPRLDELLDRVRDADRASYRTFATPQELADLVCDDLIVLLSERFELADRTHVDGPGPLRAVSTVPRPLTATIGRDGDVAALVDLLRTRRTRLVTVTGPGGVGKSRVALEVAHAVADRFSDGVHLVPVEPLTDPSDLLPVIADRLGLVGEGGGPVGELLARQLRDRDLLLLLDNLEQVVEAGPALAALLDVCPGVQALATSRRPLRLRGEHEHPLRPLPVPASDDDLDVPAVELFVERARAVRPDFELTPANRGDVAELVRRLDGLPLAIELAAARTRLLPPAALLDHLDERLDVLSSGAVDLPERQRTLRAAIDWSYRLLEPEEQRLLARLSVFARDVSIAAVEAVCGEPDGPDVLETLASLLEKSLLISTASDGEPRLQLLNTVRAYAAERLADRGETGTIADRHADWFLQRALLISVLADRTAHGRFDLLLAESDDIRRAMDHVLSEGDVARAAAFAGPTWLWFWLRGRLPEVRAWFERAAALIDAPAASDHDRAMLLYVLGQTRQIVGDAAGGVGPLERSVELFTREGDELTAAAARIALSAGLPHLDRKEEALDHAYAALDVGLRRDEPHLIGYASALVGTARMVAGDLDEARTAYTRARDSAARIGFAILEAQARIQLALLDVLEHRSADAWLGLDAAAEMLTESGSCEVASYWLEFAAAALLEDGEPAAAARALTGAHQLRADVGVVIWPLLRGFDEDLRARIAASVPDGHPPGSVDPWQLLHHLRATHARGDAGRVAPGSARSEPAVTRPPGGER
jgi:predicted ATPase